MSDLKSTAASNRLRIGTVVLVGGASLVLFGVGSWMYRTSAVAPPTLRDAAIDDAVSEPPTEPVVALARLLVIALIVAFVVLFASLLIHRIARRHFANLRRSRSTPTDSTDVWSMHRTPDITDEHDFTDGDR